MKKITLILAIFSSLYSNQYMQLYFDLISYNKVIVNNLEMKKVHQEVFTPIRSITPNIRHKMDILLKSFEDNDNLKSMLIVIEDKYFQNIIDEYQDELKIYDNELIESLYKEDSNNLKILKFSTYNNFKRNINDMVFDEVRLIKD
jgi:hypothetical protein